MRNRWRQLAILAILVTLPAFVLAAPSNISEVKISREGGNTVVTIIGDGPARTAHQSVVAKDGKPFRIVVDCLAARHALPQKTFAALPPSIVTALRTSQYAVTPEEVVRVVLDLKRETVYRVENEGSHIKVYITDSQTAPFTAWSSSSQNVGPKPEMGKVPAGSVTSTEKKPTTTPDNKPVPIQQKNQSLASQSTAPQDANKAGQTATARVPSVVKREQKAGGTVAAKTDKTTTIVKQPASNDNVKYGPEPPSRGASTAVAPQPQKATMETATAKSTTTPKPGGAAKTTLSVGPEKVSTGSPTPAKTVATKPSSSAEKLAPAGREVAAPASAKQVYGPIPPADLKAALASKGQSEAKTDKSQQEGTDSKSTLPMAAAGDSHDIPIPGPLPDANSPDVHKQPAPADLEEALPAPPPVVAQIADDSETDGTSQFRRSSAKSRRMKQTQVVQFPERIVIQYDAGTSRDPFKNLVEAKVYLGGGSVNIAQRIPNVEALTLVGILKAVDGQSAALMEDIDGIGYILRPGDKVQSGNVTQIKERSVMFEVNEYGWTRSVIRTLRNEE